MNIFEYDKGKKWYKTALHLHTPASQERWNPKVGYKEYCRAIIDAGFKIIAITDHNTADGIEKMVEARDELNDEYDNLDLLILPGVELTLYEDVHLLVIFEPNATSDHVKDFIRKLGLDRILDETQHSEKILTNDFSFQNVMRLVKEYQALSIFAHADGKKGIIEKDGDKYVVSSRRRKAILSDTYTKLVEMSYGNEYPQDDFVKRLSINHSDFHGVEFLKDPKRANWFQCSDRPTLFGIRQCLFNPERIRKIEPIINKNIVIEALKIDQGYLRGLDISFNSSLNCIIGIRGTGKSLIVDALKYVLDQIKEDELNQNILKRIYETQRNGTEIKIWLTFLGRKYEISRKVNILQSKRKGLYKYEINKEANHIINEIIEGEVVPVLDFNEFEKFIIYSQNQLQELKDKKYDQLDLIDQIDPVVKLINERDKILSNLGKGRIVILNLVERFNDLHDDIIRLDNYHDQKDKIERMLENDVFINKGKWDNFNTAFTTLSTKIHEYKVVIDEGQSPNYLGMDLEVINGQNIDTLYEITENDFSMLKNEIEEIVEELNKKIGKYYNESDRVLQEFQEEYTKFLKSYNEEIKKSGLQAEDYQMSKFKEINKIINNIIKVKIPQFDDVKKEIEERWILRLSRIKQLLKKTEEIRTKRLRNCDLMSKTLSSDEMNVNIYFQPDNIYSGYLEILDKFSQAGIKYKEDQFKILIDNCSPQELSEILMSNITLNVSGLTESTKQKITNFNDDTMKSTFIIEGDLPFLRINENLLKLQELYSIDEPVIEVTKSHEIKRLNELSVGERCSVILSLLLKGDFQFPLIIDQPEDDLDPMFIKENIIELIRDGERDRQFIFTTHNPNIPILGDADLIIKMEAKGAKHCGVLDEGTFETMRRYLLEMEGGSEALAMRVKRFGITTE